MKNSTLRSSLVLPMLLFLPQLYANTIVVQGTVRYDGGTPAAGWMVTVSIDSTVSHCTQYHQVLTDANGHYEDTLRCDGDIWQVVVSTYNCTGDRLVQTGHATSSVVESNFTVCHPVTTCNAAFSLSKDSLDGQKVHTRAGQNIDGDDSVTERVWTWGDGDSLTGNLPEASHEYRDTGTYPICLAVTTRGGCRSTSRQYLILTAPHHERECSAKFEFQVLQPTMDATGVKFNSSMSETASGDSITRRIWNWGDGSSEDGDHADPTHFYKDSGNYPVCLTIQTKQGCEHSYCSYIRIETQHSRGFCSAKFEYDILSPVDKPYGVRFNSDMSEVPSGDSITWRSWNWGDGSAAETGHVDPLHYYKQNGIYNVCLQIRTKYGCESQVCKGIVIDSLHMEGEVKLIMLYPNPVTTQLTAFVWSKQKDVFSQISVFDMYGQRKYSQPVVLAQGNNVINIHTANLTFGPYFLHVTTVYGKTGRLFFKR